MLIQDNRPSVAHSTVCDSRILNYDTLGGVEYAAIWLTTEAGYSVRLDKAELAQIMKLVEATNAP